MPGKDRIRFLYLAYLSKPAIHRPIYQTIYRRRVRTIVELGLGTGRRAVRMIEVAGLRTPVDQIQYTGIDPFESRTGFDGPGLTLRMAHRLLRSTGARIQLLPGGPFAALSRAANSLAGTDLVVISARQDPKSLARAWFYLPRMLTETSQVLVEKVDALAGRRVLRRMTADEIVNLAAAAWLARAA